MLMKETWSENINLSLINILGMDLGPLDRLIKPEANKMLLFQRTETEKLQDQDIL